MIGASVLGYPAVFAKNGMALGSCIVAASCFVSLYLCHRLSEALWLAQRSGAVRIDRVDDLASLCFGRGGQLCARVLVNTFMVARVCMYLVLIGQNANFIFPALSYRSWVLAAACLALPTAFMRDVSAIARLLSLSLVATLVYLACIGAGACLAVSKADRRFSAQQGFSDPWQFLTTAFSALAVMVFGFGPTDVLTTVRRDMSEPERLMDALAASHLAVFLVYLVAGAVGFWGFGLAVAGNVTLSMCDEPGCEGGAGVLPGQGGAKWVWGYVLAAAVVLNLSVTIPVVLYCVFTGVETGYPPESPMPAALSAAMRAGTVLSCTAVGLSLPFFLPVMSIISSALSVPVVFFLPLLLSGKVALDIGAGLKAPRLACDAFVGCLGAVSFCVGLSGSVADLLAAMEEEAGRA